MNRYRKNDKAVSPVIATILMVAITVVLAGVLVVYLQTLPSGGGGAENPVGLSAAKNSNADWLITVSSGGGQALTTVNIQVTDLTTGAIVATTLAPVAPANYNFALAPAANWGATPTGVYNDNNANNKIDAGDTILLYMLDAGHTNGKNLAGMKVQLLKGENSIGTIKELPA